MSEKPTLYALCEMCDDEHNYHPPEDVRRAGPEWLCLCCYEQLGGATQQEWLNLPRASEYVK